MIFRERYMAQIRPFYESDLIKIITGIRRCGKSYLLKEIYKEYLLSQNVNEKNIIVLELDDDKNIAYRDPINLGMHIRKMCSGQSMHYVFLDEIQKVYPIVNPNLTDGKHVPAKKTDEDIVTFVEVVLGLSREKNIDLYVTGSNKDVIF